MDRQTPDPFHASRPGVLNQDKNNSSNSGIADFTIIALLEHSCEIWVSYIHTYKQIHKSERSDDVHDDEEEEGKLCVYINSNNDKYSNV